MELAPIAPSHSPPPPSPSPLQTSLQLRHEKGYPPIRPSAPLFGQVPSYVEELAQANAPGLQNFDVWLKASQIEHSPFLARSCAT